MWERWPNADRLSKALGTENTLKSYYIFPKMCRWIYLKRWKKENAGLPLWMWRLCHESAK